MADGVSSIPDVLALRAAETPGKVAVVGNDGVGNYVTLTYAELDELSSRLAATISDRLDGNTERMVCWSLDNGNGVAAWVTYFAVLKASATNVPISTSLDPADVERIVSTIPEALVLEIASLSHLRELAGDLRPYEARGGEHASIILFTSGTTGRSKGVVHSHRSALASGAGWRAALGLGPDDIYQSTFPIYSGAGLHFNGLNCLLASSTFVIDEPRSTTASLGRVEALRSTVFAAVPTIFQYWIDEADGHDLSSLRLLDFGGAVMHRQTIEALRAIIPGVDLIHTYGLTEAGPGGLFLAAHYLDEKLGSIGNAGSGELRFKVAEPEGVGELLLAGPSLMTGYYGDPDATASVMDGEWIRSGDLVRIDEDGFVFFLDRLKDLIIRGGYNISSIEIEEALLAHPRVHAISAFGHSHPALGEVVAVAVVPEGDFDLDEFMTFARERLARQKVPAYVAVVDALPISPAGKVLKAALRESDKLVKVAG